MKSLFKYFLLSLFFFGLLVPVKAQEGKTEWEEMKLQTVKFKLPKWNESDEMYRSVVSSEDFNEHKPYETFSIKREVNKVYVEAYHFIFDTPYESPEEGLKNFMDNRKSIYLSNDYVITLDETSKRRKRYHGAIGFKVKEGEGETTLIWVDKHQVFVIISNGGEELIGQLAKNVKFNRKKYEVVPHVPEDLVWKEIALSSLKFELFEGELRKSKRGIPFPDSLFIGQTPLIAYAVKIENDEMGDLSAFHYTFEEPYDSPKQALEEIISFFKQAFKRKYTSITKESIIKKDGKYIGMLGLRDSFYPDKGIEYGIGVIIWIDKNELFIEAIGGNILLMDELANKVEFAKAK